MTISIKRKEQPIAYIDVTRGNKFKNLRVDVAKESGKVRLKVQKEGLQGILLTKEEAADLVDALLIITGKKAA